ncbi:MAG: hypothetical protein EKK59_11355 [Neisseriaceae bacterium]|nr:MAG: hypothetical protein EKK59_11355 [Neisseriaceae bacterium]
MGALGFVLPQVSDIGSGWTDLLTTAGIFGAVLCQLPGFMVRARIREQFFQNLAHSLGLSYTKQAPAPFDAGLLFTFGNSRYLSGIIQGTHSDHDIRIYALNYRTGSGKNASWHALQVYEIDTHTQLPELMVRSKEVALPGAFWRPAGTRPLTLEGTFSTQFDVFAPEGMEIEALQVLDDRHMRILSESLSAWGLYSFGTMLYVFSDDRMSETRTGFLDALTRVDKLADTLVPDFIQISNDVVELKKAFSKAA